MTCQPIPKFSTTLNGHPVFIPAMLWHVPEHTLSEAIEALRNIDEKSFDGVGGICHAVSRALEPNTKLVSVDVYSWVGPAVCYFDHTKQQAIETWLEQYFYLRFGLGPGRFIATTMVHYSREQITALRLEWLAHIIVYLEEATAK